MVHLQTGTPGTLSVSTLWKHGNHQSVSIVVSNLMNYPAALHHGSYSQNACGFVRPSKNAGFQLYLQPPCGKGAVGTCRLPGACFSGAIHHSLRLLLASSDASWNPSADQHKPAQDRTEQLMQAGLAFVTLCTCASGNAYLFFMRGFTVVCGYGRLHVTTSCCLPILITCDGWLLRLFLPWLPPSALVHTTHATHLDRSRNSSISISSAAKTVAAADVTATPIVGKQ